MTAREVGNRDGVNATAYGTPGAERARSRPCRDKLYGAPTKARKIPTLSGKEGGVIGDCGEAPAYSDLVRGCRLGGIAGLFPPLTFQVEGMTPRHILYVQN